MTITEKEKQLVAEAITDALVRVGISLEYSARKLKELIEATENKIHYDQVLCKWQVSPPLAALNIQLRALEIALKLQDAFPAEKHRHEIKHHVDLEERLRRALDGGTSDQKTI